MVQQIMEMILTQWELKLLILLVNLIHMMAQNNSTFIGDLDGTTDKITSPAPAPSPSTPPVPEAGLMVSMSLTMVLVMVFILLEVTDLSNGGFKFYTAGNCGHRSYMVQH